MGRGSPEKRRAPVSQQPPAWLLLTWQLALAVTIGALAAAVVF